ncbi:hypothetical protein HNP33_002104 [Comamonas odontotermitis]|uniref:Uncharacterized protein n=1 Tax=Comamonas odontotermitis TaxID=379895 RepID=A0ABR6RFU9_9BURK|nr:hypothetical protein [Comamonas odontotermitis]
MPNNLLHSQVYTLFYMGKYKDECKESKMLGSEKPVLASKLPCVYSSF